MLVTSAVATAPKTPLTLREIELDEPRAGEVRVRMVATGVCHTDAIVRDQVYPVPLPAVLGHEGSGVVDAVGPGVSSVDVGDHVILSYNYCGTCTSCRVGTPSYCHNLFAYNFGGSRPDGSTAFSGADGERVSSHFFGQSSFSTYSIAAERSLVKVDKDLPLEILGPLGCGIQTGSGAVLNALDPRAGSSLAIFGAGAVGLSGLLGGVVANVTTLIAIDVVDSRLELARTLGATHTINGRNENVVERIREITGGGVDYALDTTGNTDVYRTMADSLGVRGHGALVGAAALGAEAKIDIGTMLTGGARLSMVVEGELAPQVFVPTLLRLFKAGKFPFDALIKTYSFDEINQAFEDSERGTTLKPVVVF